MGRVAGHLYCDRCGDEIPPFDPDTGHSETYISWSHPVYGGGSQMYCTNPVRECSDRMLYSLGVATTPEGAPDITAPAPVRAMKIRSDSALDWVVDLIDLEPPSVKLPGLLPPG